jgi:hypothetical protein
MMSMSARWVLTSFVLTFASAVPAAVAAQPSGQGSETLVFFRNGYEVPQGKRLLIEDVSVVCTAEGALPFEDGNFTGDFERFGISGTAILSILYPPANCPEQVDTEEGCPVQHHVVGTAQTNGTDPIALTGDGRPRASIGAGRPLAAFVEQRGTLQGSCSGIFGNFPLASLTGTGRLVNR